MSRKIFTFDMDGTLLSSEQRILPATIKALWDAKAKGHLIVLCSGRPQFDMIPHANEAEGLFDYLICNNGAYFYDMRSKEFFISKEVSKAVAHDVFELAKEHESFFTVHTDKNVYRVKLSTNDNDSNAFNKEMNRFDFIDPKHVPKIIDTERVMQASICATKETIETLMKYAKKYSDEADVHVAGVIYLDVNPYDTSKLTGIQDLAKHINAKVEDFITFGDSGNDLQMLRGAGLGIAMGNATPEAKEAADEVIGDNDSDAIAKKVYQLI